MPLYNLSITKLGIQNSVQCFLSGCANAPTLGTNFGEKSPTNPTCCPTWGGWGMTMIGALNTRDTYFLPLDVALPLFHFVQQLVRIKKLAGKFLLIFDM